MSLVVKTWKRKTFTAKEKKLGKKWREETAKLGQGLDLARLVRQGEISHHEMTKGKKPAYCFHMASFVCFFLFFVFLQNSLCIMVQGSFL